MSKNLRIAELDFDSIKQNLKDFLQDQNEFTDFDFEGSGLAVLLDILAYNTHYNAYLANMLVNETFLDSAVKRASAVSIAKHLNYTPASVRGARAVINVTVNNPLGSPAVLTLPRFTPFTTSINGQGFTFLNTADATATPINNSYTFPDITVVEGELRTQTFVAVEPGPNEKFEITETNIDTSTLQVSVQRSSTDLTIETYTLSLDITGLDGESKVFFLQENPFGRYEIFFGDGVIGKLLDAGNIISVRYLASAGSSANVSDLITQTFTSVAIGGSTNVNVTTLTNSSSGANRESITSIKFKAPLVNAAKNRAVTSEDYKALISANFSDAESVTVWGGEDNIPPAYGKVFISLKPFDGFFISQTTKQNIVNTILKNRKVLAIQPELVDPEFFYVGMNVLVKYNQSFTTKLPDTIRSIIETTIRNYFSSDLQKFDKDFNKSKLLSLILNSDESIDSVLLLLKLQKRLIPVLGSQNSFQDENQISFENSLVPGSFSSSRFFISGANTLILSNIVDIPDNMPPRLDGTGTLRILNSNTGRTIESNIGKIFYSTGEVSITGFTPVALPTGVNDFRITASLQETSHNIQAFRNQILVIDDSSLNAQVGREAGLQITVSPVEN